MKDYIPLELAGQAAETALWARRMRDRYVRAAGRAGWSRLEIARATNLSREEVTEIVEGRDGDDAQGSESAAGRQHPGRRRPTDDPRTGPGGSAGVAGGVERPGDRRGDPTQQVPGAGHPEPTGRGPTAPA